MSNTAAIKWQKRFSSALTWSTMYVTPFATVQEVKLRWFQHRILTTNTFVFKLKIIDNDLCTFCNENKEYIEHLFWECNIVQTFWNRLLEWLLQSCKYIYSIQLSLELVMFGRKEIIKTDPIFLF